MLLEKLYDFLDDIIYNAKVQKFLGHQYVVYSDRREKGLQKALRMLEEDLQSLELRAEEFE